MALPYETMHVIYNRVFAQDMVDQIALSSPLMDRMMSKRKMVGGAGYEFPVRYARNNNLHTPDPYENKDFLVPKGPTNGYENYVWFTQLIGFSKQENARNMATPNDLQTITDYLGEKVEQAQDSFEYYLTSAIYGDGGTITMPDTENEVVPFPGLKHIIDTGNTVHGIAQGTYTWWQAGSVQDVSGATYANLLDSSSSYYIMDLLANGVDDTMHNKQSADLIVVPKLIMRAIKDVVDDSASYQKMSDAPAGASLSWTSINYEGTDIVADELCPDGEGYVLNTNHLFIAGNPEAWFKMSEFTKKGDGFVADIDVDMCMICRSPRHQGRIEGLPTSKT